MPYQLIRRNIPIPISTKYLLKKKTKTQYPQDVYRALKIIAVVPENIRFYGSNTFRAQPYPGDIDAYEKIELCPKGCSRKEALNQSAKLVQDLIRKFTAVPGVYLGDTKICNDKAILQYVIKKHWGIAGPNKKDNGIAVYDFDSKKVKEDLQEMLKRGLITDKDYHKLIPFVKPHITIAMFLEMREILRNIVVLRWDYDELMKGEKILPGNRKITLAEAIDNCKQTDVPEMPIEDNDEVNYSVIKPDIWMEVNGKYIELINLLVISYHTMAGKIDHISHFSPDSKLIIKNLKSEVAKYYYSSLPKFYNVIKYAKRLWTLALMINTPDSRKILEKLVYLWRSDYNLINQVKADLTTIKDMLEKLPNPPLSKLYEQADQTKLRLVQLLNVKIKPVIYQYLKKIATNQYSKHQVIEKIDYITKYLKDLANKGAKQYLKKVDLWPASKKYVDAKNFVHIFA